MNQPALCLHCDCAPRANVYRLCQRCGARRGLRHIYRKRKGWTPAWDAHLQELAERAKLGLPLFPRGQLRELPPRPAPTNWFRSHSPKRKQGFPHRTLACTSS